MTTRTGAGWADHIVKPALLAVMSATLLTGCMTTASEDAKDVPGSAVISAPPPANSQAGGYLAGRHAFSIRDLSAASTYFDTVLESDPGNPSVIRRIFLLRLEQGDLAGALDLAEKLEAEGQRLRFQDLAFAVDAATRDDFETARDRFSRMPPGPANALLQPIALAWCETVLGNPEKALEILEGLKKTDGFDSLRIMHRALVLETIGTPDRVDEAARLMRGLYRDSEHQPARLYTTVAGLLARTGSLDEALALGAGRGDSGVDYDNVRADLQRQAEEGNLPVAQRAAFAISEALFDIASAVQRERGSDSAMVYSRLAIHLQPEHALATLLAGEILDDREQYDEALALYARISDGNMFAPMARLRSASGLRKADRKDEAIAVLTDMAATWPENAEPWIRLGDLHRGEKEWQAAISAYDQAIERVKTPKRRDWSVFYSRGIAHERAKQWKDAEVDFLKALELRPEQPYVMNYLGYSWVDQGIKLAEAEKLIARAVELRPEDGYIVDSLGWVLYRTGRFDEAVIHLEKAVQLRPTDPIINDHLGDAYWQVGRRAEARFQWQRALSFEPEADLVAVIEDKLRFGLVASPSAFLHR